MNSWWGLGEPGLFPVFEGGYRGQVALGLGDGITSGIALVPGWRSSPWVSVAVIIWPSADPRSTEARQCQCQCLSRRRWDETFPTEPGHRSGADCHLARDDVGSANLIVPVNSPHKNNTELGQDHGCRDGGGYLLGSLDTQTRWHCNAPGERMP
jgi:hypothetical protein